MALPTRLDACVDHLIGFITQIPPTQLSPAETNVSS
jgi:hypothetical protein